MAGGALDRARHGRLRGRADTLLLPWGDERERERSHAHRRGARHAHVPERQPLDRVASLIAGASFVIGVDTGLLHLAAALGVPLVVDLRRQRTRSHRPGGAGPDRGGRRQGRDAVGRRSDRRARTDRLSESNRLCRRSRRSGQRAAGGRRDLLDRDVAHAAMMPEAADRLVAGPAGELGRGLDHRRDRIERRPVPRAGRPEDADRRRADRRRDMQQAGIVRDRGLRGGERQDGVAQVGAGQVADMLAGRPPRSRRRARFSPGPPITQTALPAAASCRASSGVIGRRPALRRPDRAGSERHRRAAVGGETQPLPPGGHLGRAEP